LIKARNKLKQLKHLHTTQKTFQSTMVVTTNMEEFISNIRNERMNQFWNDTKKYQKFSPTPEEIIENAPPGTFDDAEDELICTVQRYDNTYWCSLGQIKGHSYRLDCLGNTEDEAIEYAKKNKYQTFLKLPSGHTYYFRDKVGAPRGRTYDEIKRAISPTQGAQTWIIKF
tara:strand:- start:870 stop:1379 length:510 start_codon:yes stop_codon:yes gene_type:complete